MGSTSSSQFESIRKRECVVFESPRENVHWTIKQNGIVCHAKHAGKGKAILTRQVLYLFNHKTGGQQRVAISAACSAHIRPHDPAHPLVLSSGSALCFAEEVLVIRPGDSRVGGRISPPVMSSPINDQVCTEYEVLLFTEEPELLLSFSDGLNELIESDSEQYVKRMLDFTSGRLQICEEEEGSEGEEVGSQTTDMMRYTSGRASRPSRDESP